VELRAGIDGIEESYEGSEGREVFRVELRKHKLVVVED